MIRDMVETGLSRLNLLVEDREQVVGALTRVVGAEVDMALQNLLKNHRLPDPLIGRRSENSHPAERIKSGRKGEPAKTDPA